MKKFTLFMAACTLCAAASCSKDDVDEAVVASNDNLIGFMSNTTRADILTITNLKADADGFVVYGAVKGSGTWDAMMDGTNNYAFTGGNWGWLDEKPKWPTDSEAYPMNFYAYYPTSATGMTVPTTSSAKQLAFTYQAPATGQVDILAAANIASVRPAGDKLPLYFNHVLSKISFDVTAGDDVIVHTQSIGLENVCNERTYNIIDSDWEDQAASKIDNYSFLDTANPALASNVDDIVGSDDDLMLVPQETASWTPDGDAATMTGSRIKMLYRATDKDKKDIIGYTKASSHPDYNPATDSALADKKLFVMVGYPFGDDGFKVAKGNAYSYNISIGNDGATNGYLLDKYYYDENGVKTIFEVEGKDIDDPLADGYINFTVFVNEWTSNDVPIN